MVSLLKAFHLLKAIKSDQYTNILRTESSNMALTRIPISLILISSLLVIASTTDSGYGNGYHVPKPDRNSDTPKVVPQLTDKLFPIDNLIGIEGFIFCKSGLKHFPLKGIVYRTRMHFHFQFRLSMHACIHSYISVTRMHILMLAIHTT